MSSLGTLVPTWLGSNKAMNQKMFRYCGVSIINVTVAQALLFAFHAVLGWGAVVSNLLAVFGSAIPAYLLSRRWVWGQNGSHSMMNELLPFLLMTFVGLVVSSVAVGYAESNFDAEIMVNIASIAAFGVVWVVKFLVLEYVMWRPER